MTDAFRQSLLQALAVGAPQPLSEVPAQRSRAIHSFAPSNPKLAAKTPVTVGTVDVLLGNREDAIKAGNKIAAREGLLQIAQDIPELGVARVIRHASI